MTEEEIKRFAHGVYEGLKQEMDNEPNGYSAPLMPINTDIENGENERREN